MNFYPSLEAFYSANDARRRSPEADYGVWWRDDRRGGYCGVFYVKATGEVCAVHIGGQEQVEVLGVVSPDPDESVQPGYKRRRLPYYRTLDRILEGWIDHIHQPDGLVWVRERLVRLGGRMVDTDAQV